MPIKRAHKTNKHIRRKAVIPRYGSPVAGALRLAGFLSLVTAMIPAYYLLRILRPGDDRTVPRLFHGTMLRILGFRVRVQGELTPSAPTLFVSNHISYLDIHVLGSLIPASFIAKSEVAKWPLIGYLARLQKTVFVERRTGCAANQRDGLKEILERGTSLILFPEGTSTNGHEIRPFKSSLFSAVSAPLASGANVTIQPVSIACTEMDGIPVTRAFRSLYAWYGDMTLAGHLWNVFKCGNFTVDVVFHPPISTDGLNDRKTLAALSQTAVAQGLEHCLAGRARPSAKRANRQKIRKTNNTKAIPRNTG